jgi:transcriptional regulator with XRE-family HTH domain
MKLNIIKVKNRMKDMGLTTADVAKLMGVHRQTMYDTLYGKTGKTLRTIARLAKALHMDEKDLVM